MTARNWVNLHTEFIYLCDLETEMSDAITYMQHRLDGLKLRYPGTTSILFRHETDNCFALDDCFALDIRRLETDEEYKARLDKIRQQEETQKRQAEQASAKREEKADAKDKEIAELKARIVQLENQRYQPNY